MAAMAMNLKSKFVLWCLGLLAGVLVLGSVSVWNLVGRRRVGGRRVGTGAPVVGVGVEAGPGRGPPARHRRLRPFAPPHRLVVRVAGAGAGAVGGDSRRAVPGA